MTDNTWLSQPAATPYGFADPLAQRRIEQLEAERDELRAKVARVEALIGYGYDITRSPDNGGGVAIVIEETDIEEALDGDGSLLADAWDEGWTVGASALTDGYKSGRPNPYRAPLTPSEPSSLPDAPGTPSDATGGAE